MTLASRPVRLLMALLAVLALTLSLAAAPAHAAKRSKKPVSISLKAPAAIRSGAAVTLHGKARYRLSKKPVKRAKVRLQKKSGKSWLTVATVRTASNGKYSYRVPSQSRNAAYRAVLVKGKKHGSKASKTRKVLASQGISVTSRGASTIVAGSTVTVSGVVTAGLARKPLTLQRAQSGQWIDVKTVTAVADKKFSISAPIYGAGKGRQLRVVGSGSASGVWTVDVYGWFYLTDSYMTEESDRWTNNFGTATVLGHDYTRSLWSGGADYWGEFTLAGGTCTRLRTSVAVEDTAETGTRARFEMFNDGVPAHPAIEKVVGQAPTAIDVSVAGVFRIKLETVLIDGGAYRAWLDPQILCLSQPNPAD